MYLVHQCTIVAPRAPTMVLHGYQILILVQAPISGKALFQRWRGACEDLCMTR
jgi:hypothetical protein